MEKPIKVVPSSTGGKISYYTWGLIHKEGTRYGGKKTDEQEQEDLDLQPNKSADSLS